jgi:hypothetical protein
MSLVSMASPWINDDIPNKKRLSTLRQRKPKAFLPGIGEPDNVEQNEEVEDISKENFQNMQPATFDEIQDTNNERNRRIDELLNKITTVDNMDENNKMANFKPPENPVVQVRRDVADIRPPVGSDGGGNNDVDGAAANLNLPSYSDATQKMRNVAFYNFNGDNARVAGNYKKSYEMPPVLMPYFSQGGGGGNSKGAYHGDSKLMEKINYMIHMLEAQQAEKTSNITEEFILYTFLGIFIIYIVDSFARAGKYTR